MTDLDAALARIASLEGVYFAALNVIENNYRPGPDLPYDDGRWSGLVSAVNVAREQMPARSALEASAVPSAKLWHGDGDEHTEPECLNPDHFEDPPIEPKPDPDLDAIPASAVPTPKCWCGSAESQTVHHEDWGHPFSVTLPLPASAVPEPTDLRADLAAIIMAAIESPENAGYRLPHRPGDLVYSIANALIAAGIRLTTPPGPHSEETR